jgi:hypothetical protein
MRGEQIPFLRIFYAGRKPKKHHRPDYRYPYRRESTTASPLTTACNECDFEQQ